MARFRDRAGQPLRHRGYRLFREFPEGPPVRGDPLTDVLGFAAYLLLPSSVAWSGASMACAARDGRTPCHCRCCGAVITAALDDHDVRRGGCSGPERGCFLLLLPLLAAVCAAARFRGDRRTPWKPSIPAWEPAPHRHHRLWLAHRARDVWRSALFWAARHTLFQVRGIDVDYLRDPHHYLFTRLSALLPCSLPGPRRSRASSRGGERCCCPVVPLWDHRGHPRRLARHALRRCSERRCWLHAAQAQTAGAAVPASFFEAIAVGALLFIDDQRTQTIIAAIV